MGLRQVRLRVSSRAMEVFESQSKDLGQSASAIMVQHLEEAAEQPTVFTVGTKLRFTQEIQDSGIENIYEGVKYFLSGKYRLAGKLVKSANGRVTYLVITHVFCAEAWSIIKGKLSLESLINNQKMIEMDEREPYYLKQSYTVGAVFPAGVKRSLRSYPVPNQYGFELFHFPQLRVLMQRIYLPECAFTDLMPIDEKFLYLVMQVNYEPAVTPTDSVAAHSTQHKPPECPPDPKPEQVEAEPLAEVVSTPEPTPEVATPVVEQEAESESESDPEFEPTLINLSPPTLVRLPKLEPKPTPTVETASEAMQPLPVGTIYNSKQFRLYYALSVPKVEELIKRAVNNPIYQGGNSWKRGERNDKQVWEVVG